MKDKGTVITVLEKSFSVEYVKATSEIKRFVLKYLSLAKIDMYPTLIDVKKRGNRENATVFCCLAASNFNLTRKFFGKNCKKKRENAMVLCYLNVCNFNLTKK